MALRSHLNNQITTRWEMSLQVVADEFESVLEDDSATSVVKEYYCEELKGVGGSNQLEG